jgi:hypothetical protein
MDQNTNAKPAIAFGLSTPDPGWNSAKSRNALPICYSLSASDSHDEAGYDIAVIFDDHSEAASHAFRGCSTDHDAGKRGWRKNQKCRQSGVHIVRRVQISATPVYRPL